MPELLVTFRFVAQQFADPVINFMEWLNREYPGWELELDWVGEPYVLPGGFGPLAHDDPVQNTRYADVLLRHFDEYEDFIAGSGGVPD